MRVDGLVVCDAYVDAGGEGVGVGDQAWEGDRVSERGAVFGGEKGVGGVLEHWVVGGSREAVVAGHGGVGG